MNFKNWGQIRSIYHLTHWGRDKMDAFSRHFQMHLLELKMQKFRLRFHWNLFTGVQLTIFQHWFRKWLGAVQTTSHYLYQLWLVCWRIYMRHLASISWFTKTITELTVFILAKVPDDCCAGCMVLNAKSSKSVLWNNMLRLWSRGEASFTYYNLNIDNRNHYVFLLYRYHLAMTIIFG